MSSAKYEMGFMDKLWEAANRLRGKMEASQYKHIVLPLIFLKYISDMFSTRREWLRRAIKDPNNEDYYLPNAKEEDIESTLEDRDEYLSAGVFYVPPKARWSFLMKNAMQPDIGKTIDEATRTIEKENPKQLRGVLPRTYTQSLVPPHVLGELINTFSKVGFELDEDKSKDILGRVYEYFIGKFAQAEGKKGGQFYTPRCVVKLLVEMLEPFAGRVYDPACGSGGMFVQSWKFLEAHQKDLHAISVYGQEVVDTTWRICKMNLALRGIPNENIVREDTLLEDQFPSLRADFIITNPPFNMTRWGAERVQSDVRWRYGIPDDKSKNGGNYAWIQHYIYHLSPNGKSGFVMANGSLSCGGRYGKIRKGIVEDSDLVDCVVALPPKLFLTTAIPVCLWFLSKNKDEARKGFRDRSKEILFIDARELYQPISRRLNTLTNEHIEQIAKTYKTWRKGQEYHDTLGFCKSATIEEVRKHRHVLTPGRYVGIPEKEKDSEPFEQKMSRLTQQLSIHFVKAGELKKRIIRNLKENGYESR